MIRLSISAMNNIFPCPAKFFYSRKWRRIGDKAPPLVFGGNVHRLMAHQMDVSEATAKERLAAERLMKVEQGMGIQIKQRELRQSFEILPGIKFTRIIDGLGIDKHGRPIIIDYKTSGRKWETIPLPTGELTAVKAAGWQAIGYLVSPPDVDRWAKKAMYIVVAGPRTPVQTFSVVFNQQKQDEFYKALEHARYIIDNQVDIKVRSWTCKWCEFRELCFKCPHWEKNYETRGKKNKKMMKSPD